MFLFIYQRVISEINFCHVQSKLWSKKFDAAILIKLKDLNDYIYSGDGLDKVLQLCFSNKLGLSKINYTDLVEYLKNL